VWLLLFAAVTVRLGWAVNGHLAPLQSELQRAAVTLSQTGAIADAYRPGSGPTTHVGLLPPLVPAAAYWLLGANTPAAEITLTILAGLVIAGAAFVINAIFLELGTPLTARCAALLFVCLVPVNVSLEAQDLRAREAGWAALGLALLILAALRLDRVRERLSLADALGLSLGGAFLFLLSPAVGLAGYGALAILALRRVKARYWIALMALAVAIAAIVSLPWALRNQQQFGRMIWSRGNFGIEFALGTYPGAVSPHDPAAAFRTRLAEIHPFRSDQAYASMQSAGGEIGYSDALAEQTWRWVSAHRAQAAHIWLRHLKEFYFPPAWLWNPYARADLKSRLQALSLDVISLLAFAAIAASLYRRRWQYLYLAVPIALIAVPYMLAQPRLRYRYVISSMLIFLAADFIRSLWSEIRPNKSEKLTSQAKAAG
jgi:4-amino-4-deoxy-L-arabinose transferase-like glycosyltransferase